MFTGRDEIVAELIRQERLQEAEARRLYRRGKFTNSGHSTTAAGLLQRLRARLVAPRPPGQDAAAHEQAGREWQKAVR